MRTLVFLTGLLSLYALGAAELTWFEGKGFRRAQLAVAHTSQPGFTLMQAGSTGISFTNTLAGDTYLTNAVAHNGSGVALGDVDGDGWVDIYLSNLQGPNSLYRNLGGWRFHHVNLGPVACSEQLSTGAALADIDGDRDPDLLVGGIGAGTRLFLNDGKGGFSESENSGLSRRATPTSMALADIDGDGDLDLYCAHYIDEMHLADPTVRFGLKRRGNQFEIISVNDHPTTSPRLTNRFQVFGNGRVRELPEVDGFYRNDGTGRFTAIQNETGIFSDSAGKVLPPYRDWGLAVMFRDLNGDLAPDFYVCNDNASPDRMWLNSGTGTFREIDRMAFRHTSRSSMGIDIADVDRDGHDDIFVVDMFAQAHEKRLTQLVKDHSDPRLREQVEEQPRYNRNSLFLGRKDGTFAEAALMAGVAASDWSWCPIFIDVDLDGYEDLLITTGFNFDVMDQDSHDRIRKSRLSPSQLKRSRQFHPRWPTSIAAFRNNRDGTFEPAGQRWGFSTAAVANGAALADLDNDGDLDLVTNNLNGPAGIYRNETGTPRIAVRLRGIPPNTAGIGAKILFVNGDLTQSQEMICGGRYMSGDESVRVFATASLRADARLEVRWRNGERSVLTNLIVNSIYEVDQREAIHEPLQAKNHQIKPYFADVSELIDHRHTESEYDDWFQHPLLPHRLSRLGPGLSWFDLDADGWEDLLIGAARGHKLTAYYNEGGKAFRPTVAPLAAVDDHGAVVAWRESGRTRVVTALASYEREPGAPSELVMHDIPALTNASSLVIRSGTSRSVALGDIDGDGDLDLFAGGHSSPGRYPEPAKSSFWINDKGRFRLAAWNDTFPAVGLVSGATFTDVDQDGRLDLALAIEWGPIRIFRNESGGFAEITEAMGLGVWTGLWTSIATGDFDGDGRLDLVAGNRGRNSAYEIYRPGALRLYYDDWNADGVTELVEAWQRGTNFFPVRDRTKMAAVFPDLLNRFPTHAAYARASVLEILAERAGSARFVEVAHLETTIFLNRGSRYEPIPLPRDAQLSPAFSVTVADFDADGAEDLFLAQNFYGILNDITRDDSGRGLWLRGHGDGRFTPVDGALSGVAIPGEQRAAAVADFNHDGRIDLVVSQNNEGTRLFRNESANRGLRVVLRGTQENPNAIGAQLRVVYSSGKLGPLRLVSAGEGYLSQNAPGQILGLRDAPVALRIEWPNGKRQTKHIDQELDINATILED